MIIVLVFNFKQPNSTTTQQELLMSCLL